MGMDEWMHEWNNKKIEWINERMKDVQFFFFIFQLIIWRPAVEMYSMSVGLYITN